MHALRIVMLTLLLCTGCASSGKTLSKSAVPDTEGDPLTTAAPAATDEAAPPVAPVRLGVHCVKAKAGARVVSVEAGSLAQESGLQVGDIIIKYDDRPIGEVSDLSKAIANTARGAEVAITVVRATQESIVVVQY